MGKKRSRRSWAIYNTYSALLLPSHPDAVAWGFGSCTETAARLQSFISVVQATLGFSKAGEQFGKDISPFLRAGGEYRIPGTELCLYLF